MREWTSEEKVKKDSTALWCGRSTLCPGRDAICSWNNRGRLDCKHCREDCYRETPDGSCVHKFPESPTTAPQRQLRRQLRRPLRRPLRRTANNSPDERKPTLMIVFEEAVYNDRADNDDCADNDDRSDVQRWSLRLKQLLQLRQINLKKRDGESDTRSV